MGHLFLGSAAKTQLLTERQLILQRPWTFHREAGPLKEMPEQREAGPLTETLGISQRGWASQRPLTERQQPKTQEQGLLGGLVFWPGALCSVDNCPKYISKSILFLWIY